mmetsp:Transcript_54289/g.139861  ORF Transcript_54289/g.139861 Transcript_54289/m.139861 type:complete len:255 (+) Transcript_54289:3191-3955(+)
MVALAGPGLGSAEDHAAAEPLVLVVAIAPYPLCPVAHVASQLLAAWLRVARQCMPRHVLARLTTMLSVVLDASHLGLPASAAGLAALRPLAPCRKLAVLDLWATAGLGLVPWPLTRSPTILLPLHPLTVPVGLIDAAPKTVGPFDPGSPLTVYRRVGARIRQAVRTVTRFGEGTVAQLATLVARLEDSPVPLTQARAVVPRLPHRPLAEETVHWVADLARWQVRARCRLFLLALARLHRRVGTLERLLDRATHA